VILAEVISTKSPAELIPSVKTVRPLLEVFGVLLGAMIATGTGRLVGVGLADNQRLRRLTAAMTGHTTVLVMGSGTVGEILCLQVRQQSFALAVIDTFTLIARASVLYLLVIASMERVPTQYRQVVAAPAGAP
jgi:glutamate dehydrogenase/leucine dehydrogenase